MRSDFLNQSINKKEEDRIKKDKTLYEKLVIIGDKETGKTSLIQNLFSEESISMISDSVLSNSINNTNKNNEENNINNDNINNDNINNKDINKEIEDNINKKEDKKENELKNEKNFDINLNKEIKKDSDLDNNIILEQKLTIKSENKNRKNFQIFESKFFDNNIIHSLSFMCQCIIIIFDVKNMISFEKAKKITYMIKSEIKIQKPNIILVSTKNEQENNDKIENKIIDNNLIMNFIDEIIQNSIDNDSSNNNLIINKYIEVSNITKKGINELRTEILNSYEKETIIIAPLTLSINQDYNKYKNNNVNDIFNNNINQINEQNYPKKKSSSTSTKSKSSKENIFNNNNLNTNLNIIKTFSPKNLFKFENEKTNENINNISSLFNIQIQNQIKEKNCENIKIILLGDSLVGKTSFINQFFGKGFNTSLTSTIGINENSKIINYNENYYKIQIWDTAGQERFESIPKKYYEKMEGAFLFYDITNEYSFDNIIKWLKDIYECANENLIIYILGNKVDLIDKRKISFEIGNNFAKQKNMKFMEISCKLDLNISDVIYNMIYDILQIENECKTDTSSLRDAGSELFNNKNNDINKKFCC